MNDIRILVPVVNANPHLLNITYWLAHITQTTTYSSMPRSCHPKNRDQKNKTYLSKRAQPRQNTATDPSRVLPLRRRKDLYAHVFDGQLLHLGEQTIAKTLRERAAARKHNVRVKIPAQVQVRPVDRVDHDLVHARVLEADNLRVEEDFGRAEALGSYLGGC